MQIDTSLLREKFDLREPNPEKPEKAMEIVALSNRMPITLQVGDSHSETFIIRTQNMHGCVRMASVMVAEFDRLGPLLSRTKPLNWHGLWDSALSPFERLHNPDKWVAVFHNGKIIDSCHRF